jgi:hypothetical protein
MLLAVALAAPAAASDLVDFARCLTHAGATFYTAAWCPHCAEQQRMFGSAIRWVRVVDCTAGCRSIDSFPTWQFADGSQFHGVAPLDLLGARTGCAIGGARRSAPSDAGTIESSAGPGTTERTVGGARIIDVHRR